MRGLAAGRKEDRSGKDAPSHVLEDPSPEVRHRVLRTLAATPDATVKAEFRKILKDSTDPVARRLVASSFGQWCDPDLTSDLGDALKDSDAYVRANAMTSLAQMGSSRAEAAIIALLDDPSLHVRNEAIRCATVLRALLPQARRSCRS